MSYRGLTKSSCEELRVLPADTSREGAVVPGPELGPDRADESLSLRRFHANRAYLELRDL